MSTHSFASFPDQRGQVFRTSSVRDARSRKKAAVLFPESLESAVLADNAAPVGDDPDLWLYRDRTTALLLRYLRLSIETGRLPSLLGREFFRSKVTSYRMATFEDAVIFVHDVERVIDRLPAFWKELIASIIFQEYTQEETAERLRCARRTVCREFPAAIDQVTAFFLEGGLLNRLPSQPVEKTCQEDRRAAFSSSDCKQ